MSSRLHWLRSDQLDLQSLQSLLKVGLNCEGSLPATEAHPTVKGKGFYGRGGLKHNLTVRGLR